MGKNPISQVWELGKKIAAKNTGSDVENSHEYHPTRRVVASFLY